MPEPRSETDAPPGDARSAASAGPSQDLVERFAAIKADCESGIAVGHGHTLAGTHPRYTFEAVFASGGLGHIRRAYDHRLRRYVAVKELRSFQAGSASATRFEREALLTARLQHPAIVPIHDLGQHASGEVFYCMKLVDGQSLDVLVRSRPDLVERLALLSHVIAVADAVAYAHDKHIIHRDLKPSNVLVGTFGETVVIDWGLAKELHRETDDVDTPRYSRSSNSFAEDLTQTGEFVGTLPFMPPEQAEARHIDARADVYSIGAMLYFVLSGRMPYEEKTSLETLIALRAGPPVDLESRVPRLPPDLVAIVRKAMSRGPDERYPTARELAADLRRFQAGRLVAARPYSTLALLRRFIKRHRGIAIVLMTSLTTLAIGGVIAVENIKDERDIALDAQAQADAARRTAERERERADARTTDAQQKTLALLTDAGRHALASGRPHEALPELLKAYALKSGDRVIRFMLAEAMRPADALQFRVSGHARGSVRISASRSLPRFVTEGAAGDASLWDSQTGDLIKALDGLNSVDFIEPGDRLITRVGGGHFNVVDAEYGTSIHAWSIHPSGDVISPVSVAMRGSIDHQLTAAEVHVVANGRVVLDLSPTKISAYESYSGATKFVYKSRRTLPMMYGLRVAADRTWATRERWRDLLIWAPTETNPIARYSSKSMLRLIGLGDTWRQALVSSSDGGHAILDAQDARLVVLAVCGSFRHQPWVMVGNGRDTSFRFTEGGATLLMVGENGLASWDAVTGDCRYYEHSNDMTSIFGLGDYSVTDGGRGEIAVWSQVHLGIGSKTVRLTGFQAHASAISDVVSLDDETMATASADGEFAVWRLSEGLLPEFLLTNSKIWRSPDGGAVAFMGRDGEGEIVVRSMPGFELELRIPWQPSSAIYWLDDRRMLRYSDAAVELWDVRDGLIMQLPWSLDKFGKITSAEFLDAAFVFAIRSSGPASGEGREFDIITFVDWRSGATSMVDGAFLKHRQLQLSQTHERLLSSDGQLLSWPALQSSVFSLEDRDRIDPQFTPDGRFILQRSRLGGITVFDGRAGAALGTLRDDGATPSRGHFGDRQPSAWFSNSGDLFLAPRNDGIIDVWEYPSMDVAFTLESHTAPAMNAVFSDDDCFLATLSDDGVLVLWDFTQGAVIFSARPPTADTAFAFAAKTSLFATLDGARLVLVDAVNGAVLNSYPAQDVNDVFFSPAGDHIYTIDRGGNLIARALRWEDRTPEGVDRVARAALPHIFGL